MRNRSVGFLIVGISLLIGFIIFAFNRAMTEIVSTSCSHGSSCPMWGTIEFQTKVSAAIMLAVIGVGIYLIIFGKEEKRQVAHLQAKEISKDSYKEIMEGLTDDQKVVLEKIIDDKGTIFQSELVEKTKFTKVKVTRILDKLEGRGIIERKRRGMTNVVILKN